MTAAKITCYPTRLGVTRATIFEGLRGNPLAGMDGDRSGLPPPRSIPLPRGRTLVAVNDAQHPTPTPWLMGFPDPGLTLKDLQQRVFLNCRLGDYKAMKFLSCLASGRLVWLVSPTPADRPDLPLPVFGEIAAAITAAACHPALAGSAGLVVEDTATVFPSPPEEPPIQ